MQIKNAKFITSYSDYKLFISEESNYPSEVCVIGRSNVGKSSFINFLAGNYKLAKTSATPGKTRLINVFSFNDGLFHLIDLPGYGYAEAGKEKQKSWADLTEGYLMEAKNLIQAFFLLDSRRVPSEADKQMTKYLYYHQIPFTVIITKIDKLSKAELGRNLMTISKEIGVGRDNMLITSAVKNIGKDKVTERIAELLSREEFAIQEHFDANENKGTTNLE